MSKNKFSLEEAREIRRNFRLLAAISILYIGIGAAAMMYLESFSFVNSLYFSVVSLTTVGYGDYTPDTIAGKFFVMGYLIVGIGIIAALANNILRNAIARRVINDAEKMKD